MDAPADTDPVIVRIVDAASEVFGRFGTRRASIDDVARRARLSRNTVFRRMGSKDDLVRAVMLRELRRLIAEVDAVARRGHGVTERLSFAFAATVLHIRDNPLFRSALENHPNDLFELADHAGEALAVAADYIVAMFGPDQRAGRIAAEVDLPGVAELIVRVLHSIMLVPQVAHPLSSEDELRAFAARHLGPLLPPN
jgi:AcrR family transcriptional regulator